MNLNYTVKIHINRKNSFRGTNFEKLDISSIPRQQRGNTFVNKRDKCSRWQNCQLDHILVYTIACSVVLYRCLRKRTSNKECHVWINYKRCHGFSKYRVLPLSLLLLLAPGVSHLLANAMSGLHWYGSRTMKFLWVCDVYLPRKNFAKNCIFHCTLDSIHGSLPYVHFRVHRGKQLEYKL